MSYLGRISSVVAYSVVAGCGGSTTAVDTTPVTAATVVAASSIQFKPGTVNLVQGGTVTFQFQGVQHNIFFDEAGEGAPDNIPQPTANASVTRKFDTPGSYVYHCRIHPEMSGVIVVK
jgi:plastocyanin